MRGGANRTLAAGPAFDCEATEFRAAVSRTPRMKKTRPVSRAGFWAGRDAGQATATGILPIFACHSLGPVSCTLVPFESTATVTGMSFTSNS